MLYEVESKLVHARAGPTPTISTSGGMLNASGGMLSALASMVYVAPTTPSDNPCPRKPNAKIDINNLPEHNLREALGRVEFLPESIASRIVLQRRIRPFADKSDLRQRVNADATGPKDCLGPKFSAHMHVAPPPSIARVPGSHACCSAHSEPPPTNYRAVRR